MTAHTTHDMRPPTDEALVERVATIGRGEVLRQSFSPHEQRELQLACAPAPPPAATNAARPPPPPPAAATVANQLSRRGGLGCSLPGPGGAGRVLGPAVLRALQHRLKRRQQVCVLLARVVSFPAASVPVNP